jgi:hypothetical protein
MMKQSAFIGLLSLTLFAFQGCADDVVSQQDVSDSGAIGAPCETNEQCEGDLICSESLCGPANVEGDAIESDATEDDTTAGDADAQGPEPDGSDPTEDVALSDASNETDALLADISPDDATTEDALSDVLTDAADWDTIMTDCEELGIANDWTGEFSGNVTHDLIIPPEFGTPPDEDLEVSGELTFSIECIDSKLKVDGKLDGFATSAGENYPFTLTLEGYYNPKTKKLNADIVEGMVLVIIAEVYFTGVFDGELIEEEDGTESFAGTWFGEAAGTNLGELIQGDASAQGTWTAMPTVTP